MDKVVDFLDEHSYAKVFLAGLLCLGFYYYFIYDDGTTIDQQVNQIEQSIIEKEQLIAETNKKLKESEKFAKESKEMTKVFSQVLKFLPEETSSSAVTREISFQARSANVSILKTNSAKDFIKKEGYEELNIEIELKGLFPNITNFLVNLTKIARIISVKKITLKVENPEAEEPLLLFKASMSSFKQLTEAKVE